MPDGGCRLQVLLFFVTGVVLLAPADAGAQEVVPELVYHGETLENGLQILTLEDFSAPVVAVQVWYGVGSCDESPGRQGFAHLFEHLMFRGTERLGPQDHMNRIRSAGGECNAFTHFDLTCFTNLVPATQLELPLWLEAERMMFLKIDSAGFAKERDVVKEERRQQYLDIPYGTVAEQVIATMPKDRPYRWLPIGRIPHLDAATVEEARAFWDRFYVPSNATVVIAGAVRHKEALAAVQTYFEWMPRLPVPARYRGPAPASAGERTLSVYEPLGRVPAVADLYQTVPLGHNDAAAVEALYGVLAAGRSSRLYRALVRNRRLCIQVQGMPFSLAHDGAMALVGALHPWPYVMSRLNPFARPYRSMQTAIDRQIHRLQEAGVSAKELSREKVQMMTGLFEQLNTVQGKAHLLGQSLLYRQGPDYFARRVRQIRALDCRTVQAAACTYLVPERRTRVRVIPRRRSGYDPAVVFPAASFPMGRQNKVGIQRPSALRRGPPQRAPAKPQSPLSQWTVISHTLQNGMKVVIVPDHEAPLVQAFVGVRQGACSDPAGLDGLAALTLEVMSRATVDYDAEDLADRVACHALGIHSQVGEHSSRIAGGGLGKHLGVLLELLASMVQRPTFPKREIKLLLRQWRVRCRESERIAGVRASRTLRQALYGSHPYGRTIRGTGQSLRQIRYAMPGEWWSRYIQPEALTLYVSGAVDPDKVLALARRSFGAWDSRPVSAPLQTPLPESKAGTRFILLDQPGAAQSEIYVGHRGPSLQEEDRHGLQLVNEILGHAFDSRLNRKLRIEEGLTYGAGGGFQIKKDGGALIVHTSTKTATTVRALKLLLEVLREMKGVPPTAEELETARQYLTGSLPIRFQTASAVAGQLFRLDAQSLPRKEIEQALAVYTRADPALVARLADRWIRPDDLTIVVAGDARRLRDTLQSLAGGALETR